MVDAEKYSIAFVTIGNKEAAAKLSEYVYNIHKLVGWSRGICWGTMIPCCTFHVWFNIGLIC